MSPENKKTLELEIARQCAPVMAGLKPANLLILNREDGQIIEGFFKEMKACGTLLYLSERKTIWLIYRQTELATVLRKPENRTFLQMYGYKEEDTVAKMLERLAERFAFHRRYGNGFPHEMGVFLGYPLGDVQGFIRNNGKNYLYCGYWKVYENPEETRKTFALFRKAQRVFTEALKDGMNLGQAVSMEPVLPA